jgi:LmbE family N-acetylglucosaminyl deacetylase
MATETDSQTSPISSPACEAIRGAYDLQVHGAPDGIGRRIDDLDLAKEFLAHGLRGFVLKSQQPEQCDFHPQVLLDIAPVFERKRKTMESMEAQEHLWQYYTDLALRRGERAVRNFRPQSHPVCRGLSASLSPGRKRAVIKSDG